MYLDQCVSKTDGSAQGEILSSRQPRIDEGNIRERRAVIRAKLRETADIAAGIPNGTCVRDAALQLLAMYADIDRREAIVMGRTDDLVTADGGAP
jgi:hypothetical protein